MGDMLMGLDILLVREIYRHMSISPIPDAPPHLRGLMNLRGRVITVIDLNVCLNRPPASDITESSLLILKTQKEIRNYKNMEYLEDVCVGDDIVGFLIDRMDDVLTVEEKDILPVPSNIVDIDEGLMTGVVRQGDQLVILLDVTAALELVMNAAGEKWEVGVGNL